MSWSNSSLDNCILLICSNPLFLWCNASHTSMGLEDGWIYFFLSMHILNQIWFLVACTTDFQWTFKWDCLCLHKCLVNIFSPHNLISLRQPIFMTPVIVIAGCRMLICLDFDLMWGFAHSCLVFENIIKWKIPQSSGFPDTVARWSSKAEWILKLLGLQVPD